MTERPIIFSAPMVRAIIEGRKTQTRRLVKYGGEIARLSSNDEFRARSPYPLAPDTSGRYHYVISSVGAVGLPCPYGQAGDRLWVREHVLVRPERTSRMMREGADTWPRCVYVADGAWYKKPPNLADEANTYDSEAEMAEWKEIGFKSTPSIHMPRWASRITLELTGVRVERLQEISPTDAVQEGIRYAHQEVIERQPSPEDNLTGLYRQLWDKLNAKRAPWESNPFVWVLAFRRIAK